MEPFRQHSDGGTIFELLAVESEPVSGPEVANKAFLYYLKGTGFRIKRFGADGEPLTEANVSQILEAQTTNPTPLTGKGQLFAKVDGGRVELFWIKDNGDVVQLTPLSSGIPSANVQVFTSSGTWTKPANAKFVEMVLIGAGGGGGGGRRGASGSVRNGGGGGQGGYRTVERMRAADLPSTMAVTVSATGGAPASTSADNANGLSGQNGGDTTVVGGNRTVKASGGGGGGGGDNTTGGSAGDRGALGIGTYAGGKGGKAADNAQNTGVTASESSMMACGGGGYGAGLDTGDTERAGSDGGAGNLAGGGGPAGAGGTSGSSGSNSTNNAANSPAGGAGGSGSSVSTNPQGGTSGNFGGGGGGGSGSQNGTTGATAGGFGGPGLAIIITYF